MSSRQTSESRLGGGYLFRNSVAILAGAALGSTIEHLYNRPLSEEQTAESMLPFCEDIAEILQDYTYADVGGTAIDIFNDPNTKITIHPDGSGILEPSETLGIPLWRKNKTRRDKDLLILGLPGDGNAYSTVTDQTKIEVKAAIELAHKKRTVGTDHSTPVISVFSFDDKTNPVHTATRLNQDGSVSLIYGFTEQTLPPNAFQTWQLILPNNGGTLQILNPWEQYWRSMTRFSSGMKAKDAGKLTRTIAKLRSIPELAVQEDSPVCEAYENYAKRMLDENSFAACRRELRSPDRDWHKVGRLGFLATASWIMAAGQKSQLITYVIQASPIIFDKVVGAK